MIMVNVKKILLNKYFYLDLAAAPAGGETGDWSSWQTARHSSAVMTMAP